MAVFVTGFGPFHDVTDNPSAWLAERLELPFKILPVTFEAVDAFLDEFENMPYDALLSLGAGGGPRIRIECLGRNKIGQKDDVAGVVRAGKISETGPSLLAASFWEVATIDRHENNQNVRAEADAGSYLCNYLLYRAIERFPNRRVGFLHVPKPTKMLLDHQLMHIQKLLAEDEAIRSRASQP